MLNRFRRNKLIISSLSLRRAGGRRSASGWSGSVNWKCLTSATDWKKLFAIAPAKRQNLNRQPWTAEERARHTDSRREETCATNINKFKEPPTRRQAWTFHHKLILRQFLIFAKSRCCWPGFVEQETTRNRFTLCHAKGQEETSILNGSNWFFFFACLSEFFKLF